jgi:hypothetical protein
MAWESTTVTEAPSVRSDSVLRVTAIRIGGRTAALSGRWA